MSSQFQTIVTQDQTLNRIQGNISSAFGSLTGIFNSGQLLTGVSIGTNPTRINHGLTRTPQIWVLCDQNTGTLVWRTAWDSNSITLEAGASCVVSLWVA